MTKTNFVFFRWLSNVEISTHSPHLRLLWIGCPQFSFRTYQTTSMPPSSSPPHSSILIVAHYHSLFVWHTTIFCQHLRLHSTLIKTLTIKAWLYPSLVLILPLLRALQDQPWRFFLMRMQWSLPNELTSAGATHFLSKTGTFAFTNYGVHHLLTCIPVWTIFTTRPLRRKQMTS